MLKIIFLFRSQYAPKTLPNNKNLQNHGFNHLKLGTNSNKTLKFRKILIRQNINERRDHPSLQQIIYSKERSIILLNQVVLDLVDIVRIDKVIKKH